jgi:translocation and assembly module TamB
MACVALIGLAGILFLAMPVLGQNDEAQDRSRFLAFVEEKISGPGRVVRINGIEGALSSNASIAEITISDDEGVWLRISNATIVWTRSALFRGRLDIDELSAERIDVPRMPNPSEEAPALETGGFALPELPVAVLLDELNIGVLRLGEPVFGLEAELTAAGMVRLDDGELETDLSLERIDGPGGALTLAASYEQSSTQLAVDLALREPADGVVANLLNLEDRPPVDMVLAGEGQLDELDLNLTIDAATQRILTGTTRLRGVDGGLGFSADLNGPISQLVAPAYRGFFGERSVVAASGVVRDGGGLTVNRLDIDSGALNLSAQLETAADGFLTKLIANARLSSGSDNNSILLPVAGDRTTVRGGALQIDFGGSTAPIWSADLQLDGLSTGEISIESVAMDFFGRADGLETPGGRMLSFEGAGAATGITAPDPDLAQAIGQRIDLALRGSWQSGDPLRLDTASLAGNRLGLSAQGVVSEGIFSGDIRADIESLLPFADLAGRELAGSLNLTASGDVKVLSGGFDLELEGQANSVRVGIDQVNGLLAGRTQLIGAMVRDEAGLAARRLRLSNAQMRAEIDGFLASNSADMRMEAVLNSLATLTDNASGQAVLTASAEGSEGPIALEAMLAVADGRLQGMPLRGAELAFTGTLLESTLEGDIIGEGQFGEAPIVLSAGILADDQVRIVNDLIFSTDGARLSGGVRQQAADGLMIGDLSLNAPDIRTASALLLTPARGGIDAQIDLSHADGEQLATIEAVLAELRFGEFEVGAGQAALRVIDLLGTPSVEGTVNADDVAGAGVSIGRVAATATANQSFTVRARDIHPDALRGTGIAPINIEAQGSFTATGIDLARANITATRGLQATASGRVPFSGPGLNVQVNGEVPLALANQFVADRGAQVSGTATVNARATGSVAAPQVTGSIATQGARLLDPSTGTRLSGITVTARLDGQRVVIEQGSATADGGGTLTLGGQVGLDAGLPADLNLALNQARYADGTLVVATASGELTITGPLTNGPLIAGTILINQAEIQVPDSFGGATGMIKVIHVAPSQRVRETFERAAQATSGGSSGGPSSPARLNILVQAPNQIYIRGRGVNAELGGQVQLTGPVTNIQPVGAFNLIRGRIAILGQRIDLTEGSITLIGDLDPFINLVAQTEGDAITVAIVLSGRVSDPTLNLSSQPALPEDEILARLIFDRGLNELSPLQIAQLAATANELAGNSDGSIIGDIRDGLGLDDIDIITDETGSPAVRATQYVQENIYVGVEAGTSGTTRATINLDITEDLTARGAVSSSGESSLGVFFERDY